MVGGEKDAPEASTPVRRPFWSYVVHDDVAGDPWEGTAAGWTAAVAVVEEPAPAVDEAHPDATARTRAARGRRTAA